MENRKTNRQLEAENEALRLRLEEAEETLRAITNNEVDALVVEGPEGQQIFTLQGAEQPYRILMETMSEGALTITTDGTVLYCNSRLAELIGTPLNNLLGASFHDFVISRDGQSLEAMLRVCAIETCRGEFFLKTAGGGEVPVSLSVRPLMLNDMQAFCIVATDLTDQMRAREAVERARDHLEEKVGERTAQLSQAHDELEQRVEERTAELQRAYDKLIEETKSRELAEAQLRQVQKMEALGMLAGGIAHDFNNMLAAIIGFSEIAAGKLPAESPLQHQIRRVLEAAMRGRDLVKQMLTFSRQTEQEKKPLLVSSIVNDTIKFLRASIPSSIAINADVKSESGLVMGDPVQVQQILMNLCTNAAYAMREQGGVLGIELSDCSVSRSDGEPRGIKPGSYMKLVVRDTGTGISPDIIDRIFDPFFTTKGVREGTGLGLSVVHGIVKQHNGYITAASEPGEGSTFAVYLPKIAGALETDAVGDHEIPTGFERILFVDDEEALVEMGEDILAELGYEVTSRMNGREALALFRLDPSRFDLVITDQTMPEMTGIDLAREILAIRPNMPIIMCTGFSHLVDADKATAVGIRAFAMKPLTKREIARTIRKVLDA